MRQRLVLHIGMHKTGSTSIQRFFSRNRLALSLAGIVYPLSVGADGRRQSKHNAIFTAISHEADHGAPHPVLGPSAELVEATARRIEASGARVAVMSAEGFSGERPVFARALAPLGRRFDVTVVVFLRQPDDWLESFHRQMIMSREVREARPIAEFLAAPETRAHLDYFTILDWWAEAFGAGALRILPFDPDRAGRPLAQLVEAADLPRWLLALPHARVRLNRSAPLDLVARTLRENRGEAGGVSVGADGAAGLSGGESLDGRGGDSDYLRLSLQNRLALADGLETAWRRRSQDSVQAIQPPPFIFSMLERMRRDSP